jgi:predicted nucleic acid-binding protein
VTDRVLDASALAHALIGKTASAAELRIALRSIGCHAPHLIDAELGSVLRKRTRAGDITPTQAVTALRAARAVIDYRYPHTGALADLAWSWRDNLSFYDALYVALAVRLDVPLVTGDERLSKAPGLPCLIELI